MLEQYNNLRKRLFKKFTIYGHHALISLHVKEYVSSAGIYWIDHIWAFSFRLKFTFGLMSEDHESFYCEDQVSPFKSPMANLYVKSSDHPCLVYFNDLLGCELFLIQAF